MSVETLLKWAQTIPEEKLRYAVSSLIEAWASLEFSSRQGVWILTLISAYRAEVRKSDKVQWEDWVAAELKKGAPMSTDDTVYVQKRGMYWYSWKGETIGPPSNFVGHETRPEALIDAHDIADRGDGLVGYPVVGLPAFLEPPAKTQAQQDAEWLRELVAARVIYHNTAARERLLTIADRLAATKD